MGRVDGGSSCVKRGAPYFPNASVDSSFLAPNASLVTESPRHHRRVLRKPWSPPSRAGRTPRSSGSSRVARWSPASAATARSRTYSSSRRACMSNFSSTTPRLQSGQCLSSAPVPPQGEPGDASRQLVTPRKQPGRGRPSTRGAHSHCLGRSYESEPPPNPPILTAPPSTMHSGIPAAHPDGVGLLPLPG